MDPLRAHILQEFERLGLATPHLTKQGLNLCEIMEIKRGRQPLSRVTVRKVAGILQVPYLALLIILQEIKATDIDDYRRWALRQSLPESP